LWPLKTSHAPSSLEKARFLTGSEYKRKEKKREYIASLSIALLFVAASHWTLEKTRRKQRRCNCPDHNSSGIEKFRADVDGVMKARRLSSFVRHGLDNTLTGHSTDMVAKTRARKQPVSARRKRPPSYQAVHAPVALSGATSQRRHRTAYPSSSPRVAVADGTRRLFGFNAWRRVPATPGGWW
jgi:hypothetical protein